MLGVEPVIVVIRGNSGSGKSAVAAEIRTRYGPGIALVGQDNLRRVVLGERDTADGANIALIELVTRFAVRSGYHVIIDGILRADFYAGMLDGLRRDHEGRACFYYLHVPYDETLRRHATRAQAAEFGHEQMSGWYRELDLLPGGIERVIPADSTLDATVRQIMSEAGLAAAGSLSADPAAVRATADHPAAVSGSPRCTVARSPE